MANRNLWILRVSCILSILGSIIVMIACRFPKKMWKKKGRQLIFWLSVSDLATSIVYYFSSYENGDNNSNLCQTTALLGIFFPVASFLWTDFIGFYLYSLIHSRKLTTDNEWKNLMILFHILSWGIAGLCITLVGGFGHAGRSQSNDNADNTGGWCWVTTSKYSNLILWEIIGGKFVEWLSCFLILPYLYYSTAKTLIQLDISTTSSQQLTTPERHQPLRSSLLLPSNSLNTSPLTLLTSSQTDSRTSSQLSTSTASGISREQETFRNPKFQRFYVKMVSNFSPFFLSFPCLIHFPLSGDRPNPFLLCRLWGTLRIFLYLMYPPSASTSTANAAHHAADTWLYLMQAIFDPLQGFFNAILFVFLSENDRQNIFHLFCLLPYHSLTGREVQPFPHRQPNRNVPPSSFKPKKKSQFFNRLTSYFHSSSFSTSLLNPQDAEGGMGRTGERERVPQSSSQRSDPYNLRERGEESEDDHVGLSRISESGTTMRDRDSEVYNSHRHPLRDVSFVYENEYESEFSAK